MRLASSDEWEEDGVGVMEGRLEICVNRAWGTVCEESFTQDDAEVACGQLRGFKREGSLTAPLIHVDNVLSHV